MPLSPSFRAKAALWCCRFVSQLPQAAFVRNASVGRHAADDVATNEDDSLSFLEFYIIFGPLILLKRGHVALFLDYEDDWKEFGKFYIISQPS